MIQTNTSRRIDGRDTDGERWVALAAADPSPDMPAVTIKTASGSALLSRSDAAALAAWLTQQIKDAA